MSNKQQTEVTYNGAVIKRVGHEGLLPDNGDTLGFEVTHAYTVVDDFGDPAMPEVLQQKFWSPYDAAMAWDLYRKLRPFVVSRDKRTAAVMANEFTSMMAMRRHMYITIVALRKLEDLVHNARDFGEKLEPMDVMTCANMIRGTRVLG